MNKKQYATPVTRVFELELKESLLDTVSGNLGTTEEFDDGEELGSRRKIFNIWDDEE